MSGEADTVIEAIRGVDGWLSEDQAARLWSCARRLERGATAVEIGSYRGRSSIVLARALGEGGHLVAIDPHAGNDRGPRQWEGTAAEGQADHEAFLANLRRAGVADVVRHVRLPSQEALGAVGGQVDLLYVDGAHRYGPARADLSRWGERVRPGGTLLVHDAFSSVGVTVALLRCFLLSRRFRYVGRTRSLAEYRRSDPGASERLTGAARQLLQLGWFARNLLVKAALVARLRPLARLLGHRSGEWPY